MTIPRIVLALIFIVLAAWVGVGCSANRDAGTGASVAASFYPLAFAAEQIGGRGVTVTNLTPAGAEPHDLELTPKDISVIDDADQVVYLGQGFQPAVEDAVQRRSGPSVDLLAGGDLLTGPDGEGLKREGDPHVWLDPVRYAAIVRRIGDALGRPARGEDLARRVEALDAEFRSNLERCDRRQIVTSHAAFGYLARRYGLEQLPLAGLSPEAEPSPRALEELVRQVSASGATTVFFETLVSPKLAETVAREAGVKAAVLDPLEGLTRARIADGANYFSVMRENLAALRQALGCA